MYFVFVHEFCSRVFQKGSNLFDNDVIEMMTFMRESLSIRLANPFLGVCSQNVACTFLDLAFATKMQNTH